MHTLAFTYTHFTARNSSFLTTARLHTKKPLFSADSHLLSDQTLLSDGNALVIDSALEEHQVIQLHCALTQVLAGMNKIVTQCFGAITISFLAFVVMAVLEHRPFPPGLFSTHHEMGVEYNQPIILPNSLTHLTMGRGFNRTIKLPSSLTHLTMGSDFNRSIVLPASLTHLTTGFQFNQPIMLPVSLTHLTTGPCLNQSIELPASVTHFTMGDDFNQDIALPRSLTHLTMGFWFNRPIALPSSLTHLTMGDRFDQPLVLPPSLRHLELNERYNQSMTRSLEVFLSGHNINDTIDWLNEYNSKRGGAHSKVAPNDVKHLIQEIFNMKLAEMRNLD